MKWWQSLVLILRSRKVRVLDYSDPMVRAKVPLLRCSKAWKIPREELFNITAVRSVGLSNPGWYPVPATALQDFLTPFDNLKLFSSFYDDPIPMDQLIDQFRLQVFCIETHDVSQVGKDNGYFLL